MSNRMWGGRFASGPAEIMEEINASIGFDKRLAPQDIRGSLAHVAMLGQAGIRVHRERPVFTTPNALPPADDAQADVADPAFRELVEPRHCYVCKQPYGAVHPFYDQLCGPCGDLNFRKRTETADLEGRVALLTGGRVKIGYQAGIKLLRCGARLIVTTRFPRVPGLPR